MIPFLHTIVKRYKEAYSGHPPEIWTLAFITLINRMGTMVIPFLSVYLNTELAFDLKTAGLIASGFGAGSMLGSFLGGRMTDLFGPRRVIFASLFVGGIFFICIQWVFQPFALWLVIFGATTFGEGYRPAYSVAVGSFVPKEKTGRTMAFLRLAVNLGMSLAPTIGGIVAIKLGYQYLFWIEGTTCISAAFLFWYLSKNWALDKATRQEKHKSSSERIRPLKDRRFLLLVISTLMMSFVFLQWFHTVPVFIKTVWLFDESYIGLMMGISSMIVALIEMPLIDGIEKRSSKPLAMKIGLLCITFSYVFFWLPGAWIIGLMAIVIWTMGEILFLPLLNSAALELSPEKNRGKYMAVYYMSWSVSNILAPTLGFTLIEFIGFEGFWGFMLVLGAVAFAANNLRHKFSAA